MCMCCVYLWCVFCMFCMCFVCVLYVFCMCFVWVCCVWSLALQFLLRFFFLFCFFFVFVFLFLLFCLFVFLLFIFCLFVCCCCCCFFLFQSIDHFYSNLSFFFPSSFIFFFLFCFFCIVFFVFLHCYCCKFNCFCFFFCFVFFFVRLLMYASSPATILPVSNRQDPRGERTPLIEEGAHSANASADNSRQSKNNILWLLILRGFMSGFELLCDGSNISLATASLGLFFARTTPFNPILLHVRLTSIHLVVVCFIRGFQGTTWICWLWGVLQWRQSWLPSIPLLWQSSVTWSLRWWRHRCMGCVRIDSCFSRCCYALAGDHHIGMERVEAWCCAESVLPLACLLQFCGTACMAHQSLCPNEWKCRWQNWHVRFFIILCCVVCMNVIHQRSFSVISSSILQCHDHIYHLWSGLLSLFLLRLFIFVREQVKYSFWEDSVVQ